MKTRSVLWRNYFFSLGTALALACAAALPLRLTAAEAKAPRPDLTGVVTSKGGQPVANASVFIYTAGPREGIGFL